MRRAALLTIAALQVAARLSAAEPLTAEAAAKINPFKPVGGPAGADPVAHETIEFVGVSQIGNTTTLIFHDKTLKKSRWVGPNETVEGIAVVRYDPRTEQATVKINGAEKTLALRKGSGPTNSPAPVATLAPAAAFNVASTPALPPPPASLPPAPAVEPNTAANPQQQQLTTKITGPAAPEAQVKAETDARMLVSDLLEIGMAQRRAYEDAQRRAAEGKSGQPTPPAAPEQPR